MSDLESRLSAIEAELARTNALLESDKGHQRDRLNALQVITERHDTLLLGDGDRVRGVSQRIRRLEDRDEWRTWNLRTIWGALVLMIMEWCRAHLFTR